MNKSVSYKIPVELRDKMRTLAKQEGRTMVGLIKYLVEKHIVERNKNGI